MLAVQLHGFAFNNLESFEMTRAAVDVSHWPPGICSRCGDVYLGHSRKAPIWALLYDVSVVIKQNRLEESHVAITS